MRAHLQEHLYGFDDNFRMWEFTVHGTSFLYKQVSRTSNIQRSFLPPANEVCEGYVFTGVCLSTWGGESVSVQGGGSVQGSLCLRGSLSRIGLCPGVSVQGGSLSGIPLYSNEWAVRILQECILVLFIFPDHIDKIFFST